MCSNDPSVPQFPRSLTTLPDQFIATQTSQPRSDPHRSCGPVLVNSRSLAGLVNWPYRQEKNICQRHFERRHAGRTVFFGRERIHPDIWFDAKRESRPWFTLLAWRLCRLQHRATAIGNLGIELQLFLVRRHCTHSSNYGRDRRAATDVCISIKSSGDAVYIKYPIVRLVIFAASVAIGIFLWLFLEKTRTGMIIRAGVDDRNMVSASGIKIQVVFAIVFAIGAALAGLAGVVGATFQSLAPGEDTRFLLASLVVVIVGGMGSIQGAAVGAIVIGLAEQVGSVYFPTYAVVVTFLIMVAVLAFRPQGLMGAKRG